MTVSTASAPAPRRHMLVLDSAYTYDIILERKVEAIITGQDLGGYFAHVWTVHPVASLFKPDRSPGRYGRPVVRELAPRHTFIEGCVGRYAWLGFVPTLNFLLAQLDLFLMLLKVIRANDVRVVRSENPQYNGLLGLMLARLTGLPLMVGVWGNPGTIRKQTGQPIMPRLFRRTWIEEIFERFVLRRATLVMAQNEENRGFILRQGVASEKTEIFRLGNMLHPDHFVDPAHRPDGSRDLAELGVKGEPTVLCISRLQELKLTHHVILVMEQLKQRGRRATALLVGDGPFRKAMTEMAERLGVVDRVIFCGNRDQRWLARVVPSVSVVLSPLTGRALAEAALGGAPIVAYDVDWHSELIRPDETGELVPHMDYVAMADAVERLLADPTRARVLGAKVRELAMKMMDPAAANRAQIRAYDALLGQACR